MACDKKWAIFAVFVSVIVVVAIVVPISVFRNTGQQNGQLISQEGGVIAPSEMFLQFAAMIKCTTKSNPLNYQGYGCHCGLFNGGGTVPVDATDQCCKDHDTCLRRLEETNVCPVHGFITIYAMKMKGCGKKRPASITCKTAGSYSKIEQIAAMYNVGCAEALCRCDSEAAECFSRHQLNPSYNLANKNSSLCGGPGTGPGTGPVTGPGTVPGVVPTTNKPFMQTMPPSQGPAGTGEPAPLYRIA